MGITNHGFWTRYDPDPYPEGWPVSIMFCKREDGKDWYKYQKEVREDTVKCTVHEGVVQAVYRDISKLFPQECYVLEIDDIDTADPQKKYGGKKYDPEANTLV